MYMAKEMVNIEALLGWHNEERAIFEAKKQEYQARLQDIDPTDPDLNRMAGDIQARVEVLQSFGHFLVAHTNIDALIEGIQATNE
jgi:hypothetical protein